MKDKNMAVLGIGTAQALGFFFFNIFFFFFSFSFLLWIYELRGYPSLMLALEGEEGGQRNTIFVKQWPGGVGVSEMLSVSC